jgi:hypothetical protein
VENARVAFGAAVNRMTNGVKAFGIKTGSDGIYGFRILSQESHQKIGCLICIRRESEIGNADAFCKRAYRQQKRSSGVPGGSWYMTTNNARSAFLRSYHLPAILMHYPRLVRAMQGIATLNDIEAATCIRDLKAGRSWSGKAVDHYGGTHKVANDAWRYRKATNLLASSVA